MQDQQDQSLLGMVWIKIRNVAEILLMLGVSFILLNLVLGTATLTKQFSPPQWMWIQMRVFVCIYSFLMCIRVLDAYVCRRWRQPASDTYIFSVICSVLAFALALDHQSWVIAFPFLLTGFVPLLCVEVRFQLEKKYTIHKIAKRHIIKQEQGKFYRQEAMSFTSQTGKVQNDDMSPSQKVFVCYSHMDVKWVNLLRRHLRPLERQGMIDLWVDTKIAAGAIWKEEIERAIGSAAVAVVLVNANFLASDFIMQYELPKLLWCAQRRGTIIFPLFIGSCLYEDSGLERFQAINPPSKPLAEMTGPERDRVLVHLAKAIYQRLAIKDIA